jgi:hypothetical protein
MPEIVPLRNSERATYRRCRMKWHWSYNLRLAPQREKGALAFGTMIHVALAERYPPGVKRGPHPAKTFERLYKEHPETFNQWDEEGNKIPALDLGIAMLEGYVNAYGNDELIEIIQPEMPMEIDVYDRQGNYLCTWVGQSDAAYRNRSTRRVGLLEHKTAKSIPDELRINTGYGDQGLSYWWAADNYLNHHKLIPKSMHLEHVLFNWLRKAVPDKRPTNEQGYCLNKDGRVSKIQPKPLFHRFPLEFGPNELETINKRIRSEGWEMQQVRKGKLPIYKNPTMTCDWDCQFKEACEIHEMGGDWESVLELEFNAWDPYSNHELLEEKGGTSGPA